MPPEALRGKALTEDPLFRFRPRRTGWRFSPIENDGGPTN